MTPINWKCSCGYGTGCYFISCPECKKENIKDGKGNLFKLQ